MKKQSTGFFLPMTQNAVDSIARHLDIDLARALFNLFKYRKKNGLKEDDVIRLFPELIDAERNYRFHLNRLRWEIAQLFDITPPVIQKEIKAQLLDIVIMLERVTKKSNVIKELKDSNQYVLVHYPGVHGILETIKEKRKKSEQLNAKLFSSPLLDEYLMVLHSMLDYFKVAIAPFVYQGEQLNVDDYDLPSDLGLYADDDLRSYIPNWDVFIELCDCYSEPLNYEWTKKNKIRRVTNFIAIKKLEGKENYEWVGIPGGKISSFTDFIKMLFNEGIFKPTNTTKQSKAFFKFFHITDRKDPNFLLDDLFNIKRKPIYENCFKPLEA